MGPIRWFDPEPDQQTTLPWSCAALITASLFVNFPFWHLHGLDLWIPGSLLQYVCVTAATALFITGLFFTVPALTSQASGGSLGQMLETSFGTIPAVGIRICCVAFLVTWLGKSAAFALIPISRDLARWEAVAFHAAFFAYLFLTGSQNAGANATLARFTNKVGIAILLAAIIRVREGLPALAKGIPGYGNFADGSLRLAAYLAPLLFLAADLGGYMKTRKDVARVGGFGVFLPLCAAFLLTSVIGVATLASSFYTPSINPTVAMALGSHARWSALLPRYMFIAATFFGAARFGARALGRLTAKDAAGPRPSWPLMAILGAISTVCSLYPFDERVERVLSASTVCVSTVCAIVTADALSGRRREHMSRVDWCGTAAFACGLLTAVSVPYPWFVRFAWYGAAFVAAFVFRFVLGETSASSATPR